MHFRLVIPIASIYGVGEGRILQQYEVIPLQPSPLHSSLASCPRTIGLPDPQSRSSLRLPNSAQIPTGRFPIRAIPHAEPSPKRYLSLHEYGMAHTRTHTPGCIQICNLVRREVLQLYHTRCRFRM